MTRATYAELKAENAALKARLVAARLPETVPDASWLTVEQFADQFGLSLPAAYKRVERGRVVSARYAPTPYDRRLVTYVDPKTAKPRRMYKRGG